MELIDFYNEPPFYFYSLSESSVETKDIYGYTPINSSSSNGLLEIVKYLYETCHADVETKDNFRSTPINYALLNDHLDIVKYVMQMLKLLLKMIILKL